MVVFCRHSPENITVRPWKYTIPTGKDRLPTIILQGRTVKLRVAWRIWWTYCCGWIWMIQSKCENSSTEHYVFFRTPHAARWNVWRGLCAIFIPVWERYWNLLNTLLKWLFTPIILDEVSGSLRRYILHLYIIHYIYNILFIKYVYI